MNSKNKTTLLLKIKGILVLVFLFSTNLYSINNAAHEKELKKNGATERIDQYLHFAKISKKENSSTAFFHKAYRIADSLHDNKELFKVHLAKAIYLEYKGVLDGSLKSSFDALTAAELAKDSLFIASANEQIGYAYFKMDKLNIALKYTETAISYLKDNKENSTKLGSLYSQMGSIYKNLKQYDKALIYHKLGLNIHEKNNDLKNMSRQYNNIGLVYKHLKDYNEALRYLKKSLEIKKTYKDMRGIAGSLINISETYLFQNKLADAKKYSKEGVEMAEKSGYKSFILSGYHTASRIYKGLRQYDKALVYFEKYHDLDDSIKNELATKNAEELQVKYETKNKEKEITSLNIEKDNQAAVLLKNRQVIYVVLFSLLVLLILSGFLIKIYREKRKSLITTTQIKNNLEIKNKEVNDSIKYSSMIQKSIQSDTSDLRNYFKDYFILNIPKDIITGDFYYTLSHKNKKYIAVADCTGHGVPGALVSMLGIEKLNRAILEKENTNVGDILSHLNDSIKHSFKQSNDSNLSQDGMDIALICYDPALRNLEYAGANRPLLIIRNNEIIEFKANKTAIGGYTGNGYKFETKTINLNTGDNLYMFSDGYADQFGGENGKKLLVSRFKNFLISISHLNGTQQENYLQNRFKDWKENNEQVDDILVFGITI